MGGGPAGELGTYQMRRGTDFCSPAAWQSWEDGGARLVERPLPSTLLACIWFQEKWPKSSETL